MRNPIAITGATVSGLLAFPLVFLGLRTPPGLDPSPAPGDLPAIEAPCPEEPLATPPISKPASADMLAGKTIVASMAGRIKSSLWDSVIHMGEKPELAINAASLLGSMLDLGRDVDEGSRFGLVYEKRWRGTSFLGYGRILAATITTNGQEHSAILFDRADPHEQAAYFAEDGTSQDHWLRCPLPLMRVSSRFSRCRLHPILGRKRPHWGVDLAAPAGTPVMAAAAGEITFAGWSGGYGRSIAIDHDRETITRYGHLQSFARGIKPGAKVAQGQVIGYVGSTGLATGPHLDFRFQKNGEYVDPLTAMRDGSALTLGGAERSRFEETRDRMLGALRALPAGAKRVVGASEQETGGVS